jgi:steroid delta-isomerase-like uncharacterized protein
MGTPHALTLARYQEVTMSTQKNKAIVQRFFEVLNTEFWPTGNFASAEALIAPEMVYQDPATPLRGRAAYQQLLTMYRTAFPDARLTIEEQVAEGDSVLTRFSARGTHRGELLGIAPTGKPVTLSILSLVRIVDGQIAEECERFDTANLLQQVGALPAPTPVTA